MIVLLDTDILLDVALDRSPHSVASAKLLDYLQSCPRTAFVAWHSLSNFFYLASPTKGRADARAFLADLVEFADVAPTTTESLRLACRLEMRDFEDALQVAAALACGADVIATRNVRDFSRSPVRAVAPDSLLAEIS